MNKRKIYHKAYNARPINKLKRKLWLKAVLTLKDRHYEEFHKIYTGLKESALKKIKISTKKN